MMVDEFQKNVLGESLRACCMQPVTGFTRNGFCELHSQDQGLHTVCIVATESFLEFSADSEAQPSVLGFQLIPFFRS